MMKKCHKESSDEKQKRSCKEAYGISHINTRKKHFRLHVDFLRKYRIIS